MHPMQQGTQRSPPSPRSHTPLQHPSQSMQPGQPPIQSHAGTIHLHAPVASKIPPSFPGPNNLLASLNTPSQASGAPGQTPVSAALGGPPTSTGPAPERSYSGHPASGQLREQESDAGLRGYMHPLHGPPLMSSSKQHPMSHQSQHSPFGQMPGSLLGPGGPMPPATNAGPVTPAAGSAILDNPNMGAGVTLAQGQQPILDVSPPRIFSQVVSRGAEESSYVRQQPFVGISSFCFPFALLTSIAIYCRCAECDDSLSSYLCALPSPLARPTVAVLFLWRHVFFFILVGQEFLLTYGFFFSFFPHRMLSRILIRSRSNSLINPTSITSSLIS